MGGFQKLIGIGILKYIQISIPTAAFNQFPILHNMNFIRKVKCRVDFMGNEKITAPFFFLNAFEQFKDFFAKDNIQTADGFVKDDVTGRNGQRPGNAHPFLLSAGEFERFLFCGIRRQPPREAAW